MREKGKKSDRAVKKSDRPAEALAVDDLAAGGIEAFKRARAALNSGALRRDCPIQIKVEPGRKALYLAAAKSDGAASLTEWLQGLADARVEALEDAGK